jgi:hypothetical protein
MVAVTVTVAMRMAVAMSGGWRYVRDGSRRAIVRVVAVIVIVVVRVRMHSRYSPFYARWALRRSAAAYLVDILTRRGRDSVDGVWGDCQHRIRPNKVPQSFYG